MVVDTTPLALKRVTGCAGAEDAVVPGEDVEAIEASAVVVVVMVVAAAAAEAEDGKAVVAIWKEEASWAEVAVLVGLRKLRAGFRGEDTFLFAMEKLGTAVEEESPLTVAVAVTCDDDDDDDEDDADSTLLTCALVTISDPLSDLAGGTPLASRTLRSVWLASSTMVS